MPLDGDSDPAAKGAGPDLAELLETVNDGIKTRRNTQVAIQQGILEEIEEVVSNPRKRAALGNIKLSIFDGALGPDHESLERLPYQPYFVKRAAHLSPSYRGSHLKGAHPVNLSPQKLMQ